MKNQKLNPNKKSKLFAKKVAVLALSGSLLLAGGGVFCATLLNPTQPNTAPITIQDNPNALSGSAADAGIIANSPANETDINADPISPVEDANVNAADIIDSDLADAAKDGVMTVNTNVNAPAAEDDVNENETGMVFNTLITQEEATTDTGEPIVDTLSGGIGDAEEIINVETPAVSQ